MLTVCLMFGLVCYVAGRVHSAALRWARAPRPALELPRATARRTRYQRVLHGLDARDRATWPMVERMPGDAP